MTREEFGLAFRNAFDANIHSIDVEYTTLAQPTFWIAGNSGPMSSQDVGIMSTISVVCSVHEDSPLNAYSFEVPSDVVPHNVEHVSFHRDHMVTGILVTLRYRTMDIDQFFKDLKNIPYRRYSDTFDKQLEDKLD